ncbi:hypothetical protein DFH09DRAFT_1102282 [Mycena vulgaris]|nr:hypothetical protein DFH09DRAFT_1102282 [Mycena vulgaris]
MGEEALSGGGRSLEEDTLKGLNDLMKRDTGEMKSEAECRHRAGEEEDGGIFEWAMLTPSSLFEKSKKVDKWHKTFKCRKKSSTLSPPILSAIIRHSNVPVGAGEERFSFTQYTAGGLFRWIRNGFQTDEAWEKSASRSEKRARTGEGAGRDKEMARSTRIKICKEAASRRQNAARQARHRANNLEAAREKARQRMRTHRALVKESDESKKLAADQRREVDADYRERKWIKKHGPESYQNIYVPLYRIHGNHTGGLPFEEESLEDERARLEPCNRQTLSCDSSMSENPPAQKFEILRSGSYWADLHRRRKERAERAVHTTHAEPYTPFAQGAFDSPGNIYIFLAPKDGPRPSVRSSPVTTTNSNLLVASRAREDAHLLALLEQRKRKRSPEPEGKGVPDKQRETSLGGSKEAAHKKRLGWGAAKLRFLEHHLAAYRAAQGAHQMRAFKKWVVEEYLWRFGYTALEEAWVTIPGRGVDEDTHLLSNAEFEARLEFRQKLRQIDNGVLGARWASEGEDAGLLRSDLRDFALAVLEIVGLVFQAVEHALEAYVSDLSQSSAAVSRLEQGHRRRPLHWNTAGIEQYNWAVYLYFICPKEIPTICKQKDEMQLALAAGSTLCHVLIPALAADNKDVACFGMQPIFCFGSRQQPIFLSPYPALAAGNRDLASALPGMLPNLFIYTLTDSGPQPSLEYCCTTQTALQTKTNVSNTVNLNHYQNTAGTE